MTPSPPLLSVRDLKVSYGGIPAVKGIAFEVGEGDIVALVGANGAGKSSTLRAISGVIPSEGTILFGGQDLRKLPAEQIVALGIAHVPEGRGIFGELTVQENLRLATWPRKDRHDLDRDYGRVFELFPRLKERRDQPGGTLSGGEQQMLALGRALMIRPRMLLLDEPSMGLAPKLVRDIFKVLGEIHRAGATLLLIEQNANMALHLATRAHVMETGTIALSGSGPELMNNPRVREVYMGG